MLAGVRPRSEQWVQRLHLSKSQYGTRVYVPKDATGLEYAWGCTSPKPTWPGLEYTSTYGYMDMVQGCMSLEMRWVLSMPKGVRPQSLYGWVWNMLEYIEPSPVGIIAGIRYDMTWHDMIRVGVFIRFSHDQTCIWIWYIFDMNKHHMFYMIGIWLYVLHEKIWYMKKFIDPIR